MLILTFTGCFFGCQISKKEKTSKVKAGRLHVNACFFEVEKAMTLEAGSQVTALAAPCLCCLVLVEVVNLQLSKGWVLACVCQTNDLLQIIRQHGNCGPD